MGFMDMVELAEKRLQQIEEQSPVLAVVRTQY